MDQKIIEAAYEKLDRENLRKPDPYKELAMHILGMADDAYLSGHPEWVQIVNETIIIANRDEKELLSRIERHLETYGPERHD